MIKVIEIKSVEREYGFEGKIAIIDHDKHGRLLIVDGFGGMDELCGGMVRWRHGSVFKLHPDDALNSLDRGEWNEFMTLMEAVQRDADKSRPRLDWSGHMCAALAKRAHLGVL